MTNYNDGKWHSWVGGDRPIHCNSIIEAVYVTDLGVKMDFRSPAGDKLWDRAFLFRVVEEHKDLREFWIVKVAGELPEVHGHKPIFHDGIEVIHVREVLG